MTVAVIMLSSALLGALGAVAYLAYRLVAGLASERASFAAEVLAGKAGVAAELLQRKAERERDEAVAARRQAEIERDAALARLDATADALRRAREEQAHATVTRIRSARDVDAAISALDELLQVVPAAARAEPLPVVPTSDDHGDA